MGIVAVNGRVVNGFFFAPDTADFFTKFSNFVFIESFFHLIFALIFGFSAATMLSRPGSGKTFCKRLLLLAVFGILHIVLSFMDDILLIYALLGFALPCISRLGQRGIVLVVCILSALTVVMRGMALAGGETIRNDPPVFYDHTASLLEIVTQRVLIYHWQFFEGFFQTENLTSFLNYGVFYVELLTFMGLGCFLSRYRSHLNDARILSKVVLCSLHGILLFQVARYFSWEWAGIFSTPEKICLVALSSSLFCLLWSKMGEPLKSAFSDVGRMTLTWYLGFSLYMTLVLHGKAWTPALVVDTVVVADVVFFGRPGLAEKVLSTGRSTPPLSSRYRRRG